MVVVEATALWRGINGLVRKDDVDESMEESSRAPQTRTNHTKKPAKQLWLYNLLQSHSDWHSHKLVPLMIGSMLLLAFFLFSASDLIVSSRALQIASCSKNNNTFRKCYVVALFFVCLKRKNISNNNDSNLLELLRHKVPFVWYRWEHSLRLSLDFFLRCFFLRIQKPDVKSSMNYTHPMDSAWKQCFFFWLFLFKVNTVSGWSKLNCKFYYQHRTFHTCFHKYQSAL